MNATLRNQIVDFQTRRRDAYSALCWTGKQERAWARHTPAGTDRASERARSITDDYAREHSQIVTDYQRLCDIDTAIKSWYTGASIPGAHVPDETEVRQLLAEADRLFGRTRWC